MNKNYTLYNGDCLEEMKNLPDNSVDSIVTDPPYGIDFMSKGWDHSVPSKEIWAEALRVLKPGGHLLAFAGTRTQHRMAVNIEDAGFEIRDMIAWVYGSGFPKSHNISKALDKMAGAEREVVGKREHPTLKDKTKVDRKSSTQHHGNNNTKDEWDITAPATDDAKKWDGWGTALKPALEPITVARKPLGEKTVATNVLKYGTGAINIDESRIATNPDVDDPRLGGKGSWKTDKAGSTVGIIPEQGNDIASSSLGRFPANLIHDGSDEVTELFPKDRKAGGNVNPQKRKPANVYGDYESAPEYTSYGDEGSAARFFYCAKTSRKDRNEGLENFEDVKIDDKAINPVGLKSGTNNTSKSGQRNPNLITKNNHPTVKPTDLMRYLVRMVTPKGGKVLDPFMGSGSTGKAAMLEGFEFVGIELDPDYIKIAEARIKFADPADEVFDEETKEVAETPFNKLFET